jgi:signal transduction histidine kinase
MSLAPFAQDCGARLCILSCDNFHAEMQACVEAEGWTDVDCFALPARCGRPPLTWDEIGAAMPSGCNQWVLLGRACIAKLEPPPAEFVPTRKLMLEHCFHLVAGPALADEEIRQGNYLVSPGWLRTWRQQIAAMGFPADLAGEFFRDFAKGLVLLDTGLDANSAQNLHDMGAALNLPCKTFTVSLDHARLFLSKVVLEWRLEQARQGARDQHRQHVKTQADHVAALDLLSQLTRQRREADVLAGMEDLFRMLFAPGVYHYLPHADVADAKLPAGVREILHTLDQVFAWTPTRTGFVLRLMRGQQSLGFVYVDDFQFPQFKEQYLNLALAMIDVCDLSIESARTHKRLIEAEKMASLGVMVAGIAHEINTPVGVGVLAASTLQHQTRKLVTSFAERRMTQSDLNGYLEASAAGTDLIASSLERVGRLIASFRRVAVSGQSQSQQVSTIAIAECLRDTVASFGERLQKGPFEVQLDCPESLEMQGHSGDLESVFTNLIANSLQHGFKGRTRGSIHITVWQQESTVHMKYGDDGNGLSEEASKRVFDPFFTTDMQGGMGLGMHLVYNLITQRMGGSIGVDPHLCLGAGFLIGVPIQATQ